MSPIIFTNIFGFDELLLAYRQLLVVLPVAICGPSVVPVWPVVVILMLSMVEGA